MNDGEVCRIEAGDRVSRQQRNRTLGIELAREEVTQEISPQPLVCRRLPSKHYEFGPCCRIIGLTEGQEGASRQRHLVAVPSCIRAGLHQPQQDIVETPFTRPAEDLY